MVGGIREGGRREQLVQAAFRRVAEAGFEGLRLRQVAEDVGIDHSTLHYHFATKQDLVDAVAQIVTRQFWPTMPEAPDAAAAMRGHLAALRELVEQRPQLFTVTAELDLRARRDPAVRALLDEYEAGWRAALHALLARGAEQGAWPATGSDATVELLIAAVKGVRLHPEVAGPVFDRLAALLTAGPADKREEKHP